jgi:hypothetical protein
VKLRDIFAIAAALLPLAAQDHPAPLVWIAREQVQPGKMGVYLNLEEAAARTCAQLKCPNPYFALTSLTGPNEAWWINGFDTADTMEKVQREYAANPELVQAMATVDGNKTNLIYPGTNLIARLRNDLSVYDGAVAPHFFSISILHVPPGSLQTFTKARAQFKATLEHNGRPQWVYQVTSGSADFTFLVMTPARTMHETQTIPAFDDASASSETRLYAVSPSLSMPAQSWIEADPDFWRRP